MSAENRVGVDLVEVGRIEAAVACWGERFLHRVFTKAEIELCRGRAWALAARFAAKEAVMKALGTGLCGMGWCDVEVLSDEEGRPVVWLWGGAKARADALGIRELTVSLSHSEEHAIAYVLAC
ncbi:MAG: holo-ACP synthase [Chloroflexota bacterium]